MSSRPSRVPLRLRGSPPKTWKLNRRALIIALVLAAVAIAPLKWLHDQRSAAEKDALDLVRFHGNYSWGYGPMEFYEFLKIHFGERVAESLCYRRISVSMAPEKFTDNMIDHLLAIDDLDRVSLRRRTDPIAKSGKRWVPADLHEVATAASSRGIARFQKRFPHVEVVVPRREPGKDQKSRDPGSKKGAVRPVEARGKSSRLPR